MVLVVSVVVTDVVAVLVSVEVGVVLVVRLVVTDVVALLVMLLVAVVLGVVLVVAVVVPVVVCELVIVVVNVVVCEVVGEEVAVVVGVVTTHSWKPPSACELIASFIVSAISMQSSIVSPDKKVLSTHVALPASPCGPVYA